METTLAEAETQSVPWSLSAPEDFESVVREHQKRIYRLLLALLRDSDEADSLTQECFLRAFRKRKSYRGEASPATWLTRIAVNLARDRLKNRRLAFWRRLLRGGQSNMEAVSDGRRTPEEDLLAREKAGTIWAAVEELPEKRRTVFTLRYAEEMPLEEIAAVLDLEVGTVKSHLWHATHTVRRLVKRKDSAAAADSPSPRRIDEYEVR